jgi:MoaA/NifB/PqqE/SkfB family radical SAM enzyme
MNEKKYFPIQTETACRLKWSWSTLYLNTGLTASCHRASGSKLTVGNFFSFHNTEQKIIDRSKMLQGTWPGNGCEYCRNTEATGGYSDRKFQLTIPNEHPRELNDNNTLTSVNPTTLEVFFKNTCNLACIYCKASLSSRIATEDAKFGFPLAELTNDVKFEKDHYAELIPLFWSWLDSGYSKLININILGGEPFLQDDLYQLLDYIEKNPNPMLTLNIISNLIVRKETIVNFVAKIKHLISTKKLKNIQILASVDCWGNEQEYIRYGFNCDKFEENIQYLLEHKFITLSLLSTVNSLSINSMPLLAKKISEWNEIGNAVWYTHLVLPIEEHILSPNYFDFKLFEAPLNEVLRSLSKRSEKHVQTIKLLEGILHKLKTTNKTDLEKQKELVKYLTEVDRRRNLNWKKTFPWLYKAIQDVV